MNDNPTPKVAESAVMRKRGLAARSPKGPKVTAVELVSVVMA
jgi:hypothetical protein